MSGQAYKMGGLDENVSPAVIKDDVRKLQSKNRTLTFCTAFTLLLAFVGFVLAAFSARFVDENRAALEGDGSVVLRLGQSSLSGYSLRVLPLPRLRVVDQQAPTHQQDV